MKNYAFLSILIALSLILIPVLTVTVSEKQESKPQTTDETLHKSDDGSVEVLRTNSGKTEKMSEIEYLIGAVSAEMPPTYHEEALKAQAVACYTYMLYTSSQGENLSDDSKTHQGYMSDEECKEKWGKKYDVYHNKIKKACEEVLGKAIIYDGKPIMAAFHAICPGRTQSAADVWGKDVAYLKSVVSDGDRLSPDYSQTVVLTTEQFKENAKKLDGCTLPDDTSKWLGNIDKTEQGLVKEIKIGDKSYSGENVRNAFGLRSNCSTVEYKDGKFTFNVTGYGHGVGMSQYGADYMARQGSTYEEILKHYYTGTEIVDTASAQ